jgi:CheY-like chemotaxis protein
MPRKNKPAKKILLLDNDPSSLQIHVSLLKKFGCEVDTVTTGQAILDKLATNMTYDIIITDLHLPDMTLVEAVWKIRQWQIQRVGIKLIVLSSCQMLYDMAVDLTILDVADMIRKSWFAEYIAEMLE